MGRVVLGVACWLACAGVTRADGDAPEPTPAPAASSWYGTLAPGTAITASHARRTIVRGGVFALLGATYVDGAPYARLDLGVPTPLDRAPRLRTILVSEFRYGTEAEMTTARRLSLTPELQYEWRLPVSLGHGDLLIVAAAGLRAATLWVKRPDEPFWPSKWESTTAYALRVGAGLDYRDGGLVVSLQPATAVLPIGSASPPDPRYPAPSSHTEYATSLVAGYQFP